MLLRYRVTNFKNIADSVEGGEPLEFAPLTLLIGPNGVGKSSLLQSIDFLKAFFRFSLEEYIDEHHWNYVDLPNLRQSQKRISWQCLFDVPADKEGNYGGHYDIFITAMKRRYLNVGQETLSYVKPDGSSVALIRREGRRTRLSSVATGKTETSFFYQLPSSVATYLERSLTERTSYPEIIHFMEYIRKIRFASILDVENLREPQRGYADEIGPKGEALLPFLARIQSHDPENFDRIKKTSIRLFENITDFTVKNHNSSNLPKILEVYENNTAFNGKQVSDGFLRILAVVGMLYSANPPSILLFEEPENGVHPRLLRGILEIFRAMTQRKASMTQVIITSHSPYLVDFFRENPTAVYTIRRRGPRSAAEFRRLDKIFPKGLPDAPLGETWFADQLLGA
jgi:predicted ATPase